MDRDGLHGQVALVTGAGKRIGRAVALRLARQGADVVVHYHRSEAEALEVVGEIERFGRKGMAVGADLCDVRRIQELVARSEERFGRLDILVNNAANFRRARITDVSEKLWDEVLGTNLKAPFFLAQASASLLIKTRGVIINFGDIGGILPWPGYIPHCVSKAGVTMLTQCLAKALAPEVRVNAIAPGTITMAEDPSEWEQDFVRRAPLQRTGTPEEVADAVVFLVGAKFMTGQTLVLDGGRTL